MAGRPSAQLPERGRILAPERLVDRLCQPRRAVGQTGQGRKAWASTIPRHGRRCSAQGIFRGSGRPGKIAFLFPGQGSQ